MGIGPKSTVKELRSDPLPVVWIYPKAYYLMAMWARLAGKQSYEFTCLGRAVEETLVGLLDLGSQEEILRQ